jgi:arylsulfatase A-like enzyme
MRPNLLPALGLLLAAALHGQDARRPNVVLIVSDDQGWADIGINNPAVHSPNLDALAAGGATLLQNYVMPQCTPTRVALLTGRYPGRFGPHAQQASNAPAFPLGTPTLAGMFRDAGYTTHLAGKWHLGSAPDHGPQRFGFDSSYGSLAGAVGMYDHRYREGRFEQTWHRDGERIGAAEDGVHATDLVAAEAVRVIEAAAAGGGKVRPSAVGADGQGIKSRGRRPRTTARAPSAAGSRRRPRRSAGPGPVRGVGRPRCPPRPGSAGGSHPEPG